MLSWGHDQRCEVPDVRIVLSNGPVAGKNPAGRSVENAHPLPFGLIMPDICRFPLLDFIAGEIGEHHPRVMGMGNGVDDGVENARFERVEIAALQQVHDPCQIVVRLDI